MNFWKKKIKDVTEISRATGIEEEKIKELKNGEREIGGETMEKVLNAINESNKKTMLERKIEEENIIRWFKENDVSKLIHDFGYESQGECVKKIGIAQSSLNTIIRGHFKGYSTNMQKIYDFFNNDFNKKVKKEDISKKWRNNRSTTKLDYLKSFTFAELRNKLGYSTNEDLSKAIGISRGTMTNIWSGLLKTDSEAVEKIYDFVIEKLNNKPLTINKSKKEESKRDKLNYLLQFRLVDIARELGYKSTEDLAKAIGIGYSTLKLLFTGHIKYDTNSVIKTYNFVKENLDKYENKEEKNDDIIERTKTTQISTKEEDSINILDDTKIEKLDDKNNEIESVEENTNLLDELAKQEEKIKDLENRIRRYEILIDRLK